MPKILLICTLFLLLVSPALDHSYPPTSCEYFTWDQTNCSDSCYELYRWTYCRCVQAGGDPLFDCWLEGLRAEIRCLEVCVDP